MYCRYLLYGALMTGACVVLEVIMMRGADYGYRTVLVTMVLASVFIFAGFILFGYRHVYRVRTQVEYTLRDAADITEGIEGEDSVERLCRALIRMNGLAGKKKAQEILIKQAEFSALQNQINPHFLYNTLECIRGKAYAEGVEQIASMTEALSAFFRYSINIQENLVTLGRELENTKNYFLIQKYRFGNRFSLEIRFEEAGCLEKYLIPKMTLQPIVENAIFHGLEKSVSEGVILVEVVETDRRLLISVQDNGVGMSQETLKRVRESLSGGRPGEGEGEHTGIALSNINERIRMHFGSRYSLSVNSEEGVGTEVVLTLPKMERQREKKEEGP